MTNDTKWPSPNGHAIASDVTDKLPPNCIDKIDAEILARIAKQVTKTPENVSCGNVSNVDVFPLFGYEICDKDFFAGTMKNNGGKVDDIWWMTDITDYSEDALQRQIKRVEFINRAMNEQTLTAQPEAAKVALDDLDALYAKLSENDKPKPTLEDFGRVLYMHEKTIRTALTQPNQDVNKMMLEALKKAADIFREYERIHLSKSPPDRAKAERNGEYAYIMEQAIFESDGE